MPRHFDGLRDKRHNFPPVRRLNVGEKEEEEGKGLPYFLGS
jgi:hypothetical protein